MVGMIDLRDVQEKSADAVQLQAYLQQLVGQPFLQFHFSYGDELSLHFGPPVPSSSPRLKGLVRGSYILGTRASDWFLRTESPPVIVLGSKADPSRVSGNLKPLSKQELENGDLVRRGARVVF